MDDHARVTEYRRKSHALEMRSKAFRKAEGSERTYRGLVNLIGFAWIGLIIAIEWSVLLTGRAVLLGAGGWLVVRLVGNAIVTAWANAYIRRVKAEWPTEAGEP